MKVASVAVNTAPNVPIPRAGSSLAFWVGCWTALTVLFCLQVAEAATQGVPPIIWFGKLLPLVLFVPGMVRDRLRSFIWLCFVSLFYFIALVERLFATPGSVPAILGMVSVVVLFICSMLYVRSRARECRAAQGNDDGERGELA